MSKFAKLINNKPLKTKMTIVMFIPIIIVIVFYILMSNSSQKIIDQFDESMSEQLSFFKLMEDINLNIAYLDDYFDTMNMNALEKYYLTKEQLEEDISNLYMENYSKDIKFNIKAIDYSFRAYTQYFEQAISQKKRKDPDFFYDYYNALHVKDYTELYFENIMNIFLEEATLLSITIQEDVEKLRIMYFGSVIFLLLLVFVILKGLTGYLINPIKKLSDSAKEISNGNLNVEVVEIENQDEITDLAHAFNIMVESVKENLENLEQMAEYEKELRIKDTEYWKMKESLQKSKFKALQSQIEPHFLFNTLNTISRMSMFEEAHKTSELIQSLAALFRHRLRHDDLVSLEEELSIINEYLKLQKVRFDDRLQIHVDQIENTNIMIPIFTIQPIVENAIIHGIEPKIDGGKIEVLVSDFEDSLVIEVIDTGTGISEEKMHDIFENNYDNMHIGLINVRTRFLSAFDNRAKFELESTLGSGTRVTMTIYKDNIQ